MFDRVLNVSALLKLFCCSSKRDLEEGWYIPNWWFTDCEVFTLSKEFSIILESWKYNTQANKRLTKVQEKWPTIKSDIFVLSFIFFIRVTVISVMNRSDACYFLHVSGFDNYLKITICDHVHVPKLWCTCFTWANTNQVPYLLPSNFPNNFSQACPYLNRMKDW